MRIRTVKPEFWEDEGIGAISRDARLLYIATWNMADDEGLLRWTADYIKAQVFVYDADMTLAKVSKLMQVLVDADFVFPYVGGRTNQRLAFVIRFRKHQRINRPQPSKLPPPSVQSLEVRKMYGRRDGMICHICGGEIEEVGYCGPSDPYDPDNHVDTLKAQQLSLDHVVPRVKGGSDYPSNIRSSHKRCNLSKGPKDAVPPPHSLNDSWNDSMNGAPDDDESFMTGSGSGSGSGSGREKEMEGNGNGSSPSSPYAFNSDRLTAKEIEATHHRRFEEFAERIAKLCQTQSAYVQHTAGEVAAKVLAELDHNLVDECIHYCENLTRTKVQTPAFLLTTMETWGQQRGVTMPPLRLSKKRAS